MDEHRERQPAPERLSEIPEPVRKWLNSLDEEDIDSLREWTAASEEARLWFKDMKKEDVERHRRWDTFVAFCDTGGRYGKVLAYFLMSAFGLYTAALFLWDQWKGKQ